MDVTHISLFWKSKCVHVAIDTFSGFRVVTDLTGVVTKINLVIGKIVSLLQGVAHLIKVDNGTAIVVKH